MSRPAVVPDGIGRGPLSGLFLIWFIFCKFLLLRNMLGDQKDFAEKRCKYLRVKITPLSHTVGAYRGNLGGMADLIAAP